MSQGHIISPTDLRNSDLTSEVLIKKLHRAQEALLIQSDTSSAKTLSASFGPKWPYKRTMSAPASMLSRQDYKLGNVAHFPLFFYVLIFTVIFFLAFDT